MVALLILIIFLKLWYCLCEKLTFLLSAVGAGIQQRVWRNTKFFDRWGYSHLAFLLFYHLQIWICTSNKNYFAGSTCESVKTSLFMGSGADILDCISFPPVRVRTGAVLTWRVLHGLLVYVCGFCPSLGKDPTALHCKHWHKLVSINLWVYPVRLAFSLVLFANCTSGNLNYLQIRVHNSNYCNPKQIYNKLKCAYCPLFLI